METLKKWLHVAVIMVIALIFMRFGQKLGRFMFLPLINTDNDTLWFIALYGHFIGIWILVIAFCLIFKRNRKYFKFLGWKAKGNKLSTVLAIGLPTGLGINLFIAVTAMLHGDIRISFAEFNLPLLLLFLIVVTIQCGAEELVSRWFVYQKICDIFPKHSWIAFLISALGFSAIHLFNPGVTPLALSNIVLVGILYALIIYYYDSFWGTVLAHTGWNFCQSIILGLPNSGVISVYSIFELDTTTQKNSFAYNTDFGIEGTVMASVMIFIACVVIWYFGSKKKKKELQEQSDE